MKRVLFALVIATSILAVPEAQVRFGDLNVNSSSELLFSASTEMPGLGEYSSHFIADIPRASMSQLTVFPERIRVYESSGVIQIQNRFGLFRSQPPGRATVSGEDATSEDDAPDGGRTPAGDDARSTSESDNEPGEVSDYTAPRPDLLFQPFPSSPPLCVDRISRPARRWRLEGVPTDDFLHTWSRPPPDTPI